MNSHENLTQYESLLEKVTEDPWILKKINFEDYQFSAEQIQMICITAMNKDPSVFYAIPINKLDREISLAAVRYDGNAITRVPTNLRDLEMYSVALSSDIFVAQILPPEAFGDADFFEAIKNMATRDTVLLKLAANSCPADHYYKLCLEVVKVNGMAWKNIPEDRQDYAITLTAVAHNAAVLTFVKPKNFLPSQYLSIIEAAIKKNIYAFNAVKPEYLPSPDVYRGFAAKIVDQEGCALSAVDRNFRDQALCLKAVKKDGLALESVPPENFNDATYREICLEAIKENAWALEFIPPENLDRDLILQAVKSNGYVLQFVPQNYLDYDMCFTAVKNGGGALAFVPANLLNFDLLLTAVKKDGTALKHIKPEQLSWLTEDQYSTLCHEAVKQCSRALEFVNSLTLKKNHYK